MPILLPPALQAYLRDLVGLVQDHKKVNVGMKRVTHFFCFPAHIKAIFTCNCGLLNMQ